MQPPFTRKQLTAYLLQHEREFPEMDGFHIEIRDRIIAAPPENLKHDKHDQVLILVGLQHR